MTLLSPGKEVIPLASKFDSSPHAQEARSTRPRWLSRVGGEPSMTREDIRRDAAAKLGVPVGLLEPSTETRDAGTADAGPDQRDVIETHGQNRRRHRSLVGWLRNLVLTEPADARRQRLEAQAAAELGLARRHQSEQPVG